MSPTIHSDATGDTRADAGNQPALALRGAWGSLFRVELTGAGEDGVISIIFRGDADHAAFDNLAFATGNILLACEDRGDTLHRRLNKLDSVWVIDVAHRRGEPIRILALGRDEASTLDAHWLDANTSGFQNEGDNEPTGLHASNLDSSVKGMLGGGEPGNSRLFITQQHGLNRVFEVIPGRP